MRDSLSARHISSKESAKSIKGWYFRTHTPDGVTATHSRHLALHSETKHRSRLNYPHTLGMSYCFEASMSVKLCENVFDVIIHSSRADVELIGNCSCAVALCQTF